MNRSCCGQEMLFDSFKQISEPDSFSAAAGQSRTVREHPVPLLQRFPSRQALRQAVSPLLRRGAAVPADPAAVL